jgi:hypothetical protein
MKTWADVAKKNLTQSKVITAKTVKEADLIIYGVKEGEEDKNQNGARKDFMGLSSLCTKRQLSTVHLLHYWMFIDLVIGLQTKYDQSKLISKFQAMWTLF